MRLNQQPMGHHPRVRNHLNAVGRPETGVFAGFNDETMQEQGLAAVPQIKNRPSLGGGVENLLARHS